MAISKIKLLDITADVSKLDDVLTHFVQLNNVHPVLANDIIEKVHGSTSFVSENPCEPLLEDIKTIEEKYPLFLSDVEQKDYDISFNEIYDYLQELKEKLNNEVKRIEEQENNIRQYVDALTQVKHLQSLDIPLDDLFACEYITFRFGRLPKDSVDKLQFFRSKPFVFTSFEVDNNYSWCMYYTTKEYKREIDNVFSSLFFERIYIPDFVHGRPFEAIEALEKKIEKAHEEIHTYEDEMADIAGGCVNQLSCIKAELVYLNKIFEAKKYVVGLGDKFQISMFLEEQDISQVKGMYEQFEDIDIEVIDADSDKRIQVPTKLKNGWFSSPFSMFVKMYGLPSYKDLDPTPFVAWSYAILFGMMFGDLGQGLVLALLGGLMYKKSGSLLGAIGVRIGLVSALFGLLYGSVFGNEEILIPFYTNVLGMNDKPIHIMDADFTMTLLIAAIGIGVTLLLVSMTLNIIIKMKKKAWVDVICSHNGFAGMLLYGFVITAAALSLGLSIDILTPLTTLLFIVVPLILIFMKEPFERRVHGHKMFPNGVGGFVIEGFFEVFEILLSYVTNTMSFLRVGGFVLSHAGMMLVVMSLMEMVGGSGSILVLVLGNIFVMGLEGLIVGIQVLRLQFYELFSRYYEGNGVAFQPLNIK